MKPPKGVTLVSAKYVNEYKFLFTFSNGKENVTDFLPIINHGTMLLKFLDIAKFKKIIIDKERGDIFWGKDWDMCFHIESYYGVSAILPPKPKIYMKVGTNIVAAEHVEGYKIRITFSDGYVNVFDYTNLVMRNHGECIPYRPLSKFKKFHITRYKGSIGWGRADNMSLHTHELYYKTEFKSKTKKVGKRMVQDNDYIRLRDLPDNEPSDLCTWMYQNKLKCIEDFDDCLCVKKEHYDAWIAYKKEQKTMRRRDVILLRNIPKEHFEAFSEYMKGQTVIPFENGKTIGFHRHDYDKWLSWHNGKTDKPLMD